MNLIGKKIRIIDLDDPYADLYNGKVGIVEAQGEDYEHQVFLRGTWGGITIYPDQDEFEIVDQKGE